MAVFTMAMYIELDKHLSTRTYYEGGDTPTDEDLSQLCATRCVSGDEFPHVARWQSHIVDLTLTKPHLFAPKHLDPLVDNGVDGNHPGVSYGFSGGHVAGGHVAGESADEKKCGARTRQGNGVGIVGLLKRKLWPFAIVSTNAEEMVDRAVEISTLRDNPTDEDMSRCQSHIVDLRPTKPRPFFPKLFRKNKRHAYYEQRCDAAVEVHEPSPSVIDKCIFLLQQGNCNLWDEQFDEFFAWLNSSCAREEHVAPTQGKKVSRRRGLNTFRQDDPHGAVGEDDECLTHSLANLGVIVKPNRLGKKRALLDGNAMLRCTGYHLESRDAGDVQPGRYVKWYRGHFTAVIVSADDSMIREYDGPSGKVTERMYHSLDDLDGKLRDHKFSILVPGNRALPCRAPELHASSTSTSPSLFSTMSTAPLSRSPSQSPILRSTHPIASFF